MGRRQGVALDVSAIASYLRRAIAPDARFIDAGPLTGDESAEHKSFGYGEPVRVRYSVNGDVRMLVLHTMAPDAFGHDRRADRVAQVLGAYDICDSPAHVHALDVGFVEGGELISGGRGEPFLVTEFAHGELYAHDLHAIAGHDRVSARDDVRLNTIVAYLATMASRRGEPAQYRRAVRDVVGSGEGIFGLRDAYADDDPVATPTRLAAIVVGACEARERLRKFEHRATQTHGDLHPYNILFGPGDQLHLLDRSRGGIGDIADDVTCLAINYLAFALRHRGSFIGALRELWAALWSRVIAATADREMLSVVPLFFTWRTLVLASPVWYPDTPDAVRHQLLRFSERLLAGATFDPDRVDALIA